MTAEKQVRERNLASVRSPERVPLHEQRRNILTVGEKEGMVRRWVNDVTMRDGSSRIEAFKLAGWRITEDKTQVGDVPNEGNQTLGTGARRDVSQGVKAVLMEIPKDIYESDQRAKQQKLTEDEQAFKRSLNSGKDGTYGKVEFIDSK